MEKEEAPSLTTTTSILSFSFHLAKKIQFTTKIIFFNFFPLKIYFDDNPTASGKLKAISLENCGCVPAYPTLKIEPGSRDLAKLRKVLAFKVFKHTHSFSLLMYERRFKQGRASSYSLLKQYKGGTIGLMLSVIEIKSQLNKVY